MKFEAENLYNILRDNEIKEPLTKCANCGVEFKQSDYSKLCDFIMKHKPACCYECNKALGQIRKINLTD